MAILHGSKKVVKKLIELGADVNSSIKSGSTALHTAAFKVDIETIELLLKYGATFNKDDNGNTPLHRLFIQAPSKKFDPTKIVEATKLLMNSGSVSDLDNLFNDNGNNCLHVAAMCANRDGILALIKLGVDVGKKSKNSKTIFDFIHPFTNHPLAGDEELRKVLIKSLEERPKKPMEKLFCAIREDKDDEIEKILHNSSININHPMVLDRPCPYNAISLAIVAGSKKAVKKLIELGADVNAPLESGETALHVAAGENDIDIIEFLLEHGATFNKDKKGNTPLHCFFSGGFTGKLEPEKIIETTKLLMNAGSVSDLDNLFSDDGNNCLHVAVLNENRNGILALIKLGVDITKKNRAYCTAFDLLYRPSSVGLPNSLADDIELNEVLSLEEREKNSVIRDILSHLHPVEAARLKTVAKSWNEMAPTAQIMAINKRKLRMPLGYLSAKKATEWLIKNPAAHELEYADFSGFRDFDNECLEKLTKHCPNLKHLDLIHTNISGNALKHLENTPKLKTLKLWCNKLDTDVLKYLKHTPKLHLLGIGSGCNHLNLKHVENTVKVFRLGL